MTKKKQVGVRFDSNRTRLKTGETQRPNGTYAYRWSTPDGKRHSIYAPTLEKLREQEEQIIVDKHDGIRSDVKSITVNEMFNLWCQLKRGIKDSTFKNYIYMYELFVKPSFGKNRLVQVKKSDVRKFYNSLADGKVLKIATIDNVHNVLHQVFQVAVDDGMIRQNPTDNMLKELKLSHGFEREKKEALTVAQQKLFFDYMLSHPKDTHWYPVFYVMANTGMRVGEITGLRWSDIDLKKGIIRVNHTLVYNDLGTTDPHLLSEWDYEKNSKWTPSNVSRNSMKVVWWKCGAGHSYRAKITDRTIEQKGCPQCEAEFQQALPQMLIMMYGAQNGITVKSNSDSELGMRLVAYLPELHCAVDIAGATVTEKREQSVKAHICQSNRLGYYLIKRTADASQMAAEIKTLFIRNHIYLHTDSEKDVQVLRERFLEWKYRNACKLNGKY